MPQPRTQPESLPLGLPSDPQAQPVPGTWQLPFTNLLVPSPDRAVVEGLELLRIWHPRNPEARMQGRHTPLEPTPDAPTPQPRPEPGQTPAPTQGEEPPPAGDKPADEEKDERSEVAKIAMLVGLGGGFAQNGLDVVRLLKKYPEALRAGQFDPGLGRLGRVPTAVGLTFLTRPDNRIIDPLAPRVASLASVGKSFTRWDELAMKSSVLLGASLAGLQIASSVPNLIDALDNEGPWYENLAASTSGRAGVLQLAGGTIGAAIFAKALSQTVGHGGEGVVGRVLAAGKAPIMAQPIWGRIGLGMGALVAANELGFLDMFNKDEDRTTGEVLADAAHRTPVVSDSSWRTGVLLAAGGIVGFKAHRSYVAAGHALSGVSKGQWIGAAVTAGLLGAQLLGGLSGLDKPSK
jgi:hypothetical protein